MKKNDARASARKKQVQHTIHAIKRTASRNDIDTIHAESALNATINIDDRRVVVCATRLAYDSSATFCLATR